jgi:acyl carrier protein
MDKIEINRRVKKVIAQILEIDESNIADNANFVFDLGASSMKSLELVAAFEEEFNIEMDEDKSLEVQSVAGAVEYITTFM